MQLQTREIKPVEKVDAPRKRAVVSLSGGLDSSTVAYMARRDGYDVVALTINYGQRHIRELESAKAVAKAVGAIEHRILDLPLNFLKTSALTNPDVVVPSGRSEQQMGRDVPVSYVPGRNTIFLSIAASIAEDVDADRIYCGVTSTDASGYPDCRPQFIDAFNNLLKESNKRAVQDGRPIEVVAPLLHWRKEDTIQTGLELHVPYEKTWSCYIGGDEPCNTCDSCVLRARAWAEVGRKDPLLKSRYIPDALSFGGHPR